MRTLDLVSLISLQQSEQAGNQPHGMRAVLLAMLNFDSYSTE